jgi:signal transduction histidine kinase
MLLFTAVGLATVANDPDFRMNRFLLRPIYLVVLGYMIAHLGGHEITLKERLSLLREMTTLSNPRFGANRTLGLIVERLRDFYNADSCVLILQNWHLMEPQIRRAERERAGSADTAKPLAPAIAQQLLALPQEYAVRYQRSNEYSLRSQRAARLLDVTTGQVVRNVQQPECCERVASLLDTDCFFTIPLRYRGEAVGRLFLIAPKKTINSSDAPFLTQVFELVFPLLDNIYLLDRMASDAAEEERHRIARDIHDSVIQPFMGLRMGLAAVRTKLDDDLSQNGKEKHKADREPFQRIHADLGQLSAMTDQGIEELRHYIGRLKGFHQTSENLQSSVRRFAEKFTNAAAIEVYVEAKSDFHLNDRLAAEAFQMVAEGLSNIRRHTNASYAIVELGCKYEHLVLQIKNPEEDPDKTAGFVPRSITERAAALGGSARVTRKKGQTVVHIRIPL